MIKLITFLLSCLALQSFAQADFMPAQIYQLDDQLSHHTFIVEKSTHKLHIFESKGTVPKLLKTYDIATGKITGNKSSEGDKKTPEGIYILEQFFSAKELLRRHGEYGKIYGAGAFTISYPNVIDKRKKKSGNGIWLHSTDDDDRIKKGLDSKGCVVATDSDIKEIAQYIELGKTPIIILQNMSYLPKETWSVNKNKLQNFIISWANAWKNKDFNSYISKYSKKNFLNNRKGNYNRYKAYKKAVFSRNDTPQITFSNISIFEIKDYVIVSMIQDYRSEAINDVGRKTLYLQKDHKYNWKIVAEKWSSYNNTEMAFIPQNRFFTAQDGNKNASKD
jgi:murein L,D-transpeptidase YafK